MAGRPKRAETDRKFTKHSCIGKGRNKLIDRQIVRQNHRSGERKIAKELEREDQPSSRFFIFLETILIDSLTSAMSILPSLFSSNALRMDCLASFRAA